jgi:type I site-specific restriction endonuclease
VVCKESGPRGDFGSQGVCEVRPGPGIDASGYLAQRRSRLRSSHEAARLPRILSRISAQQRQSNTGTHGRAHPTARTDPQAAARTAIDAGKAGFPESSIESAFRETTNQDIAAGVIGYIRQAALGDALIPYEQRVDQALQKILASKSWNTPQREWLKRLAEQTKANLIVDREALDEPDLIFKREGGGFKRLDRIFDGSLQIVLDQFNESIWPPAA